MAWIAEWVFPALMLAAAAVVTLWVAGAIYFGVPTRGTVSSSVLGMCTFNASLAGS